MTEAGKQVKCWTSSLITQIPLCFYQWLNGGRNVFCFISMPIISLFIKISVYKIVWRASFWQGIFEFW